MKKPHKKWSKYTLIGGLWINVKHFKDHLTPTATGCVEWTGAQHRQGYGFVGAIQWPTEKRIMTVTHRVAMRLHLNRDLTTKEHIQHTCGNKLCCNPQHLVITQRYPIMPARETL